MKYILKLIFIINCFCMIKLRDIASTQIYNTSVYKSYLDCDYYGFDLVVWKVDLVQQCERRCHRLNRCTHYTYNKKYNKCYLKEINVSNYSPVKALNAWCGVSINAINPVYPVYLANVSSIINWSQNAKPSVIYCINAYFGYLGCNTLQLTLIKTPEEYTRHCCCKYHNKIIQLSHSYCRIDLVP